MWAGPEALLSLQTGFDVRGSSAGAPLAPEALEHLGGRRQRGRTWQAAAISPGPFISVGTCGLGSNLARRPRRGGAAELPRPPPLSSGAPANIPAAIESVTIKSAQTSKILRPLNAPGFGGLAQLGGGGS